MGLGDAQHSQTGRVYQGVKELLVMVYFDFKSTAMFETFPVSCFYEAAVQTAISL